MLDGANSTKCLTCRVSLQSSHANFQNIFVSPNIADILHFRIFAKHKNAYILKTVLDRADCADFGCHNSITLETKHFLNTLALTFISAKTLLCPPHWGVDILFLLFPASHLVSRHFRQQFLSYLYQIWHAGLLG